MPSIALTPRERELLGLLSIGQSRDAIRSRLGISNNTFKNHLVHIHGKLGVYNTTAAIVWFLQNGGRA